MTVTGLLQGAAVVLALEGIAYAVAPEAMRRALATLLTAPVHRLRVGGLVAAAIGVGVAWLLQGG